MKDPVISSRWVTEIEEAFRTCGCPNNVKIDTMTWEEFKELFQKQFIPHVEIERIATELLTMRLLVILSYLIHIVTILIVRAKSWRNPWKLR